MFLEDVFLENAKSNLFELVNRHQPHDRYEPFQWDIYVAKSLLQKSIRRADTANALSAARFLVQSNERAFWKRLCIIALEDIGVANVLLVAQTLLLERDRALRNQLGSPRSIADTLVMELCASPKDRCTDDLIDAINWSPYACVIAEFAELLPAELLDIASSQSAAIQHRAIAAIHLSSATDSFSTDIPKEQTWERTLQMFPEDVLSPCSKITAMIGLHRTRSIMAPFMALLSRDVPTAPDIVDDRFPVSVDLSGLPSWVLDGHTRLGLHGFRIYLKRSVRMARFLEKWATREVSPSKTVAGLMFRTESAQLARKIDWQVGDQLKLEACANRPGLPPGASAEGLTIIHEEFELVNECRADAVRVYLR